MAKKAFFRERTEAEILKLDVSKINTPVGLVDIIESIDPGKEALLLDFPFVHPDFQEKDLVYGSRRTMRGVVRRGATRTYPSYISLKQPRSREDALKETHIPLDARTEAFYRLSLIPEENIFCVGYIRFPITGNVRPPILTSFRDVMDGAMIDSYTGKVCKTLPKEFNAGAFVEYDYGPNVFVKVPSKRKGHDKYLVKWSNVATKDVPSKKILAWNTRPYYGVFDGEGNFVVSPDAEPEHKAHNVGHAGNMSEGESFDYFTLYPQGVAAHNTLIRYFMRQSNLIPLQMSQVAIPSYSDASFWNKLRNNVLILENSNGQGQVPKPLRIDQKSMLMARRVAKYFRFRLPDEITQSMYWDSERDGRIRDYPWQPGEK